MIIGSLWCSLVKRYSLLGLGSKPMHTEVPFLFSFFCLARLERARARGSRRGPGGGYLGPRSDTSIIPHFKQRPPSLCTLVPKHWGHDESCEELVGLPIGGESLAEQYFMEPSIDPDGVLPKVGTRCHHVYASPGGIF